MSDISKVLVLGTGVLGAQIAFQTAYKGFSVTAYDINEAALAAAKTTFTGLVDTYRAAFPDAEAEAADKALARIGYSCDLAAAVADADIVIEAIPEILQLKRDTFAKLNQAAPERTIFATNSSSLLPSAIADATGRPDRFLAMHFANMVWQFNTAEIMGTPQTSPEVFETVVEFAKEIGMVPIPIKKEVAGYLLNSLLIPFLNAALSLVAGGYAEPNVVDEVWRTDTGSPMGPFQIYDIIGLSTPYNMMAHGDEHDQKLAAWLKENYIDKGRTGAAAGAGFYDYNQ
ncbi:3-hydroxybutyryl-CoA dehydrogenase [Mycolicibacter nonchromogenicus]|uniref:3-hydroxybutyryl-CoA dehydrogenase n=1 Tax=Mycolicibacter nonchromogenicus TaxID=1782 RepID=A0A1X1ZBK6_MYCNO|nr:3-hydroxyacyl-CoA dehydrogenase [Mycolicibacter nonchromogenicus]ORW20676.1 3-hydroxybutyryl-CoA dehydrogenase [Mycolicibacter nonchromogenicus]